MGEFFQFADRVLNRNRAHVMGILNVTPDSFSDGGRYNRLDSALKQAEHMVNCGAALVDVGGESTRPGAKPVSVQQEMDRVLPVIEALGKNIDTLISVDTSTPEVITAAAALGAHLINDVRALQRPGALEAAADTGLPVCLMHMQGKPETMQERPEYEDVLVDVREFLRERINACKQVGIKESQLILDPGFGFGKTIEHNLRLMNQLDNVILGNMPLLVGVSRKSMIGQVLNNDTGQRLNGSLALAAAAVIKGAWIVRVHDVQETVEVITMMNAVRSERADL